MSQNERKTVLDQLATLILEGEKAGPIRIAIDGRTASGKTTFSDELARALRLSGRQIIRTSIDGFHRPKVERYARGRHSAEGYYFDARDLGAIRTLLLDPLAPTGNMQYRTASFDLAGDMAIEQPAMFAAIDSILIVDGTFLQRPGLIEGWDITVFLDASESVSEQRGVNRDADRLGGIEAAHRLYAQRYRPAFDLYEAACRPQAIADAVLSNDDLAHPRLHIRPGGRLSPSALERLYKF